MVEQVTAKLPNAMTLQELVDGGMSLEDAKHEMNKRVFGHNYRLDAEGNPIEQGFGSEANPQKGPHLAALKLEESRKMAAGGNANADVIAKAVAAGLVQGARMAREEAAL